MSQVFRATFSQVKEAQRKLKFDFLENLIEKNEIIAKESREDFYDTIAISCLGFEKNYDFYLTPSSKLGNLATWLRKCLDFKDTVDKKQILYTNFGNKITIENKMFWRLLLDSLYEPMSDALQLSLKVSAEQITREGGSYGLTTRSKIKDD
jgi:hypothetical protein